jgi:hypothetical protein
MPELRQARGVVDLDYPPFFINRVEDEAAPPAGATDPATRKERLRRPRPIGQLADSAQERSDTTASATTWY